MYYSSIGISLLLFMKREYKSLCTTYIGKSKYSYIFTKGALHLRYRKGGSLGRVDQKKRGKCAHIGFLGVRRVVVFNALNATICP
jgi:hypothetical protein